MALRLYASEDIRAACLSSAQFLGYYVNFIKTGNPNGLGLAPWDPVDGSNNPAMLILDVNSHEVHDANFEARNKFIMENKM